MAGKVIAVGFPRGKCQAYPDGTPVAEVAAAHVYGMGVPVRDFMAYADPEIRKRTTPYLQAVAEEINKPVPNQRVIDALMEAAGQEGAQAIKDAILEGEYTPNADATVEAKGSDKPLIDTTHMLNSATYVVRDK